MNSPWSTRQRQRIEHPALDRPLQRPRAVHRIVSFFDDQVPRFVGELDPDLPILEPPQQRRELDVDDLPDVLAAERVEEDDVVDPVQELRLEVLRAAPRSAAAACPRRASVSPAHRPLRDVVAADVRRHDDDGVLEVDRAALAVGEPAVVEQLQHDVQHLGVRLLDLVEQHDRVRPPPDGLGQLPGLLVADVSGRRADQPRHGVLLLVLRHVDADHRVLVVEQELGERPRQLGLADAGRARER